MEAPTLFPARSPLFQAQPAPINKKAYYRQASNFFKFWHNQINQVQLSPGNSLDQDWMVTSLTYCDFGIDAVSRQAQDEIDIFARQLNCCLSLGQKNGVVQMSL